MKLPNAARAIVEQEKVRGYVLNSTHPYGGSKARFFGEFGFNVEEWQARAAALQEHGETHDVALVRETPFGPRFEVNGELNTPGGLRPRICTVWQLDHGQDAPRLITAYPLEAL